MFNDQVQRQGCDLDCPSRGQVIRDNLMIALATFLQGTVSLQWTVHHNVTHVQEFKDANLAERGRPPGGPHLISFGCMHLNLETETFTTASQTATFLH